uniref:hypothetical protein n=1 Tax=Mariniphaga sediminis TaxID=1628158 RepID=UPI0035645E51
VADRLERAFFNAGPAAVSRDYKTHIYFQSPNRLVNGSPGFPHGPMAKGGSYETKHSPLCCTAALNRIVPWYVTNMWMATYDNGLAATCYGPCKVTALAANRVQVVIDCKTDYPFNETIEMSVEPEKAVKFPLSFHIPGWCANPSISINGSVIKFKPDSRGFASINRKWQPGDTVSLHFPMEVCVKTGFDNSAGGPYDGKHIPTMVTIPDEKDTAGAPYASVSYGPLLFALPIPDTKDANTPDSTVKWNYALDLQEKKSSTDFSVERQAMPDKWDWPLASPLKLKAQAAICDWTPAFENPRLPDKPITKPGTEETITLVPYGCTKFRVSMFPVTERTLQLSTNK